MNKILKELEKLKLEMYEDFKEDVSYEEKCEISEEYIVMLDNYRKAIRTLSVMFSEEEELKLVREIESLRSIEILKWTEDAQSVIK